MDWPIDTPTPPVLMSILSEILGGFRKVVVRSWESPTFRVVAYGYAIEDDGVCAASLDNAVLLTYYDTNENCWVAVFATPR